MYRPMALPKLPLIATLKTQWPLGLAVGIYATITYGLAGHFSELKNPQLLALSTLDKAVPFVPWTFWIYSSVSFIFLSSCLLQRDIRLYNQFLYSYIFAYTLAPLYFVCQPTIFPREAFPIPDVTHPITKVSFEYFRAHVDNATNCWPSMHIASCVMSTAPFYKNRPRVFAVYCLWSLAIAATTLTTKQHYAADLLPGAAVGLLSYLLATKLFRYA